MAFNTLFRHKSIFTSIFTWKIINDNNRLIIDYVLCDDRLKSFVIDTRVRKGAILTYNDHYLVVSQVGFPKKKKIKKTERMFHIKLYRVAPFLRPIKNLC